MKTTHGQRINDLLAGQSIVLEKVPAGGSLEARKLPSGVTLLYWRHTRDGRTDRVPIGNYDSSTSPKALQPTARGYSVAGALEAARELAKTNRETPGGLRAARERQVAESAAAAAESKRRQKFTLEALCSDYALWLKKQGKWAWSEARNTFERNLIKAFPDTARKSAADVQKREIVAALRALTEAGKNPTARKLRSYLRAAYACAVKADSDASLPSSFLGYGVTTNPVEGTASFKTRADKNPLAAADLRTYWKALQDEEGVIGAALRLHVLTGGQRPTQLARLKRSSLTADTLCLLDPKGRRTEPRRHLLPITKEIGRELQHLAKGEYLMSTDGGKTPMHASSLSVWSASVASRAGIQGFQLKRVRSGIETMLADAGVPLHIRGQLQSHGIGGIQERHYDAHEYLPQKRQAVEALYALLVRQPSNKVTPLRRRRSESVLS